MNKEIKREIILDNYQNPVNRGLIDDKTYILKNTNSDSCIDNIDLMLKIVDNKIVDAKVLKGAPIIKDTFEGESVEKVKQFGDAYMKMAFARINKVIVDKEQQPSRTYNLKGMEVKNNGKGIVIMNGKKVIINN